MQKKTMKAKNRVVVLLSGNGSNLQALIDQQPNYSYTLVGVVSNNPNAFGLKRAEQAQLPVVALDNKAYPSRDAFEQQLIQHIDKFEPDLIVLAGFMRILSAPFVQHYPNQLINIHPSLLPDYKGLHTHKRVLEDQQTRHGTTIHFVNEALDDGAIIMQASMAIKPHDTEQSLLIRVQKIEHCIYPMAIDFITSGRLTHNNGRLSLDDILLDYSGYQLKEQQLINP